MHWAHHVRQRFPDGQLYVNLRGFDPGGTPTEPAAAIRGFLDALGVPARRIPTGLDAQIALYRSLLTDWRMLVVLDNARDAGQVRPLLPGTPGCLVVITSRNQLTSLIAADGARPLVLDLLPTAEARELLGCRLGTDRVAADVLAHLGDTQHAAGNPDAARDTWQHALTILDDLDHPHAEHVRTKLAVLGAPTDAYPD